MTTALVTGGCRGLGRAISAMLREEGITVVTLSQSHSDRPDVLCDLEHMTKNMAHGIIAHHEPDILINNAGITRIARNEDLSQEDWDAVMAVNVRAPFLLSQAMLRVHGREAREKTVVNIISMGSKTALRCSVAYNASKAGLAAITKQMAREAADRFSGFVFYGVSPSGIEGTDMTAQCLEALVKVRGMTEDEANKYISPSPLGRLESAEEVVSTVRYLVVDRPVYLTGTNIEHTGAGPS
jgi:NAD(P)-dependent dehydrogenase (short-subunit alcohol dehydrogenase family)